MAEMLTGAELTCRQIIDFVQAFIDDELPSRERTIFELHLKICPDCVNYLDSYLSTQRISKLAAEAEPDMKPIPDELIRAILAARKEI